MKATRERILDAYQEILATDGERAASMNAVANRAGVSKGGLIYNFPSKDDLVEGLCDRVRTLVDEDLVRMRKAPEGAAIYYIRTSVYEDSPLDRGLLALARLQDASNPGAQRASRKISQAWINALEEEIGDESVAAAVKLIGDGLYYEALSQGGEIPHLAQQRHGLEILVQKMVDQVNRERS